MAQIPEKVLAWLHSVLHDYQDSSRTYSDSARVLSAFPSISPRTEVYTYENGASALLLTLSGTLPVTFRGTPYRFPVKLWVPQAYPQQAPMAFVTAGKDMGIRPGQHVGVDGRVYHPYLRDWTGMWDRASMAELLEYLQQVFAKEPPVISRAQQQQYQRPIGQQQPPMPPQLPPKQRFGGVQPVEMPTAGTPPPKPPKSGDVYADSLPPRTSSRNAPANGPPLPPLPHERPQSQQFAPIQQYQNGYAGQSRPPSGVASPQQSYYQGARPAGPPLLPVPQSSLQQYQQSRTNHDRSPVSPVSPVHGYGELPPQRYSQAHPPQQQPYMYPQQAPPPQAAGYATQPQQQVFQPQRQQQGQPPQAYPPNQRYQAQPQSQHPIQPQKAPPPPDLLSDPFDISLPGPSSTGAPVPAPPIPPNPEKEHLLHALSTTFVHQAQTKLHQNLSALAPLQAQNSALQLAHTRLENEIHQLEALSSTLDSNEAILRRSIQECDEVIAKAKGMKEPAVDEVLVAPTMVANQLWTLCAEEAACREAMYVLQKGLDRGRVSGVDFVRGMRGLGRECFFKMVLARKCARGMGLEVG